MVYGYTYIGNYELCIELSFEMDCISYSLKIVMKGWLYKSVRLKYEKTVKACAKSKLCVIVKKDTTRDHYNTSQDVRIDNTKRQNEAACENRYNLRFRH